jgi:hypothetical protein
MAEICGTIPVVVTRDRLVESEPGACPTTSRHGTALDETLTDRP